jgi:SAM-dependent methyltransferase
MKSFDPSTAVVPDLAEIERYLTSFEIGETWRAERDQYISSNLIRFRESLSWLPPAPYPGARLLELGASPYLFTLLLKRYTAYEIEVAGEDLPDRAEQIEIVKQNTETGERYVFLARNFNVELDRYPYKDDTFDIVLCCELIEHLVLDPTHMLVEIHRVLKPGGKLMITTPNVLVLRHINALVRKRQNIYGPYSGYGVYGRHNREWTLDEVIQLVSGCGYVVERAEIKDTYRHRGYSKWLKQVFPHLRDVIFVLARAEGDAVSCYPDSLYVAQYARYLRKEKL